MKNTSAINPITTTQLQHFNNPNPPIAVSISPGTNTSTTPAAFIPPPEKKVPSTLAAAQLHKVTPSSSTLALAGQRVDVIISMTRLPHSSGRANQID
jgi:hypothetical protein